MLAPTLRVIRGVGARVVIHRGGKAGETTVVRPGLQLPQLDLNLLQPAAEGQRHRRVRPPRAGHPATDGLQERVTDEPEVRVGQVGAKGRRRVAELAKDRQVQRVPLVEEKKKKTGRAWE